MKVALLVAGYLRSIDKTAINIRKEIFNSFQKNTTIHSYVYESLDEHSVDKYFNPRVKKKQVETFKTLNIKKILSGKKRNFDTNPSINNLKNYWYKFYKLFSILKSSNINYDLIIKLRADIAFGNQLKFDESKYNKNLIIPVKTLIDKIALENHKDPYLSDIYAHGSPKVMEKYLNFYKSIDDLTSKYGKKKTPETYLYHYLNDNKISYLKKKIEHSIVVSSCNVIAISGDSGTGKTTLANLLKKTYNNSFVLEGDRYHKWERKDKKWDYITHLDPKANYIAKMENDILKLKLGKNIFQVDYDHSNGKFTSKKKIKAKNNLIVCGLHSVNGVKNNLYNLKIYMDTDAKLKKIWKINRDTKIRNKPLHAIINEINKRKKDYKRYINPQKKKSHLIIRYYLNQANEISLDLFISKLKNIQTICEGFKKKNIKFRMSNYDKKFVRLSFYNYKKIKLFKENYFENTFSFYDYIIFVILNMHD
jgi:uridine kinase